MQIPKERPMHCQKGMIRVHAYRNHITMNWTVGAHYMSALSVVIFFYRFVYLTPSFTLEFSKSFNNVLLQDFLWPPNKGKTQFWQKYLKLLRTRLPGDSLGQHDSHEVILQFIHAGKGRKNLISRKSPQWNSWRYSTQSRSTTDRVAIIYMNMNYFNWRWTMYCHHQGTLAAERTEDTSIKTFDCEEMKRVSNFFLL